MIFACLLGCHVKTWITFLVTRLNITYWITKSWSHTFRCLFLTLHDNHLFWYQEKNMSEARTSSTKDEDSIRVTHFLSWFFFLVISFMQTIIVMFSKETHLISGKVFNTVYTGERKNIYHQSSVFRFCFAIIIYLTFW